MFVLNKIVNAVQDNVISISSLFADVSNSSYESLISLQVMPSSNSAGIFLNLYQFLFQLYVDR